MVMSKFIQEHNMAAAIPDARNLAVRGLQA
jgi:hypothetical protein